MYGEFKETTSEEKKETERNKNYETENNEKIGTNWNYARWLQICYNYCST